MNFVIPVSDLGNDLILHIGPPKTGSSSLQRVLNSRRKKLLEMNICSPDMPAKERNKYAVSICKNPGLLVLEPRSIERQKLIISAESMSGAIADDSFFELIRHCKSQGLIQKIQVVYVKKSFKRIIYSEFNQSCFHASSPSAALGIKIKSIEAIKEFICNGRLRSRSQTNILNKLIQNNLDIVVLDLKAEKDVNALFFDKFLGLASESLKLRNIYANITETREREAQVLEFIEDVLNTISPKDEYESTRLGKAFSCLRDEKPSYKHLIDALVTTEFHRKVQRQEDQYHSLISKNQGNIVVY